MIRMIAAVDEAWGIGREGRIPWYLPEDLKHFSKLTTGQHVIMGRATADSIPRGLPNRTSWIVSRQSPAQYENPDRGMVVHRVGSLDEALQGSNHHAWIIGGQSLYEEGLPLAREIYLTRVVGHYDCDRFFPQLNTEWGLVWEEAHSGYRFLRLRRG